MSDSAHINAGPYPIRNVTIVPHVWIPMRDGVRLSARLWLPAFPVSGKPCTPTSLHVPEAMLEPPQAAVFPAVLEYIPYRKNDFTAVRDSKRHDYLAGYGFACVRVDLRGSGDSEGILEDEYLPLELQDACDCIAWIAAQPWCNGRVGMFGKSWGAFNALQVASLRPPALKAIIAVAGTHDRFAEDVHFTGGCVQAMGMLPWASTMLGYNCRPPNATHVRSTTPSDGAAGPQDDANEVKKDDSAMMAMWKERLANTPHFVRPWLSHQTRDAYWQHGSVCEDYSRIAVPVLAVGGWADGYTSFVLQLHEKLPHDVPFAGILGPWAHQYPEEGSPGPRIAFAQESVMWWGRWLLEDSPSAAAVESPSGADLSSASLLRQLQAPFLANWKDPFSGNIGPTDRGVLRSLRVFVLDLARSSMPRWCHTHPTAYSGRWVALGPNFMSGAGLPARRWRFAASSIGRHGLLLPEIESTPIVASADDVLFLCPAASARVGQAMGSWWGFGESGEAHGDQSADDAASITFTSQPFEAAVEFVGVPRVALRVALDTPTGFVAVRLSVVDQKHGERSMLVSFGVQNLNAVKADPNPLQVSVSALEHPPHVYKDVIIDLRPLAIRVSQGQSLRIAVSQQLWPLIWPPSSRLPRLRLRPNNCSLVMPSMGPDVYSSALDSEAIFASTTVEMSPPRRTDVLVEPQSSRHCTWDACLGQQRYCVVDDSGIARLHESQMWRTQGGPTTSGTLVFGACESTEYMLGLRSARCVDDVTATAGASHSDADDEQVVHVEPKVSCEHLLVVSTDYHRCPEDGPAAMRKAAADTPPVAWIRTNTVMQSTPSTFIVTYENVVMMRPSLPASWAEVRSHADACISAASRAGGSLELSANALGNTLTSEPLVHWKSGSFSVPRTVV